MRTANFPGTALFIAMLASIAAVAAAQEIRIGSLEGNDAVFVSSPVTLIDWSRPAGSSGSVNTATVAWSNATSPCDGIFTVRFYAIPSNALVAVMTAERGPFRAVNGLNTVALDPPVNVTSETFIGIRRGDGPDTCGQPYGTFTRVPGRALFTSSDFKNGSVTALSPSYNFRLQAEASNVPSVRVETMPAVALAPGASGSFFRTSMTLANPSGFDIHGKLVFHAAGKPGSASDPSFDFVVPARGALNYDDLLTTLGQSGLGSLDILTTASPTPIANARVFNDAGPAGTNGFSEDAVPIEAVYDSVANIFVPTDTAGYRLNIGIRSFQAGTINVAVYDAAGVQQMTTTKTYPADYFEQPTASNFLGGATPPPGGRIVLSAFSLPFIAYGAVTDNRTNDPSMRIGSD